MKYKTMVDQVKDLMKEATLPEQELILISARAIVNAGKRKRQKEAETSEG